MLYPYSSLSSDSAWLSIFLFYSIFVISNTLIILHSKHLYSSSFLRRVSLWLEGTQSYFSLDCTGYDSNLRSYSQDWYGRRQAETNLTEPSGLQQWMATRLMMSSDLRIHRRGDGASNPACRTKDVHEYYSRGHIIYVGVLSGESILGIQPGFRKRSQKIQF